MSRQVTTDELLTPPKLRPAAPGESFVLVLDRNPSGEKGPGVRDPKRQVVKKVSLSINEWAESNRRNQLRREMHDLMEQQAEAQGCPSFLDCRPTVQVIYYFATNSRDRDWQNWVPKPINDALKACGIIVDDCDRLADILRPVLKVDPQRPRIEIVITDTRAAQKGA